ncbi:MAG: hypothetical protein MJY42_04560 [Bacteroidales bacterium]|nr:hypothetical protein [Bacteroidales bacterium]
MFFKYKVTLSGIKGFHRIYAVNSGNTLYSFHKQMLADMEFPMDVPILFKALDPMDNVLGKYALVDLGYGTVDKVTINDTVKAGAFSFIYYYDTVNRKSVNITFDGDSEVPVAAPTLLDSKGPNPVEFEKGYVSFEDMTKEQLADDFDDEDDDDEGDIPPEEEVADEDED